MTELAFAKSFLTSLDQRPTKIPADHIEDPRSYPARSAYILPKSSHPLPKRQKLAPGAEPSLTVSLKSLRNPPLDITLKDLPPNTSILDLKTSIEQQTTIPLSALRLLHRKKPVPDSKVLKDVISEGEQHVEFSVMVIGGAAAIKKVEEEVIPESGSVAQGSSGNEELKTDEFWKDLKGFLSQRLRDEKVAEKVSGVFRGAWQAQR